MFLDFGGSQGFCYNTSVVFQFIGYVVLVLKILIPSILIVLGVIALGKAVIAADDKEIKTAVNSIIKKFIAAVAIFFIPTIISALFTIVNGFGDIKSDYEICVKCITNPTNGTCKNAVNATTK
ncbi:MAG: hypothetical protein IJO63_04860 [Bacilli bacterium]|nr:hypothetical protein [Bacilli bacterium]